MNDRIKLIIAATVIAVIIGAASYTHIVREETRVTGLMFGNSILDIQDALKVAQDNLALRTHAWESENMTDGALLEYYDEHYVRMDEIIARYDALDVPPGFGPAVTLFKISAESQQKSNDEFALWIKTGDPSNQSRSDELLQDAFEYESEGIAAFNDAKRAKTS